MDSTKRILFIVTSHDQLGSTGRKTGFYLPEVAHPYNVLAEKGFVIDIASPKGGAAPMDGTENADEVSRKFLADKKSSTLVKKTLKLSDVKPAASGRQCRGGAA